MITILKSNSSPRTAEHRTIQVDATTLQSIVLPLKTLPVFSKELKISSRLNLKIIYCLSDLQICKLCTKKYEHFLMIVKYELLASLVKRNEDTL